MCKSILSPLSFRMKKIVLLKQIAKLLTYTFNAKDIEHDKQLHNVASRLDLERFFDTRMSSYVVSLYADNKQQALNSYLSA